MFDHITFDSKLLGYVGINILIAFKFANPVNFV